jgi:hypothetical protein
MVRVTDRGSIIWHALGWLGLLLLGLTGWVVDRLPLPGPSVDVAPEPLTCCGSELAKRASMLVTDLRQKKG